MLVKLCVVCGAEFDAYRPNQRYCSGCRQEGRRRRERKSGDLFALPPVSPTTFVRKSITKALDGECAVIISDLQYPFHDQKTWRAVVGFIDDFDPDLIVWNGDIGDFYSISVFDKNPKRAFNLSDELWGLERFLASYRMRWGDAKHYFILGNHEERLESFIKKTPELTGLVDLDSVLHLSAQEFNVLPYGGILEYLGFAITHGTRFSSLPNGTAKMHAQTIGGSGVVGHSHRLGSYTYTDLRGTHTFFEGGCLCRLDPDYVKQRPPNWQQGFLYMVAHKNKAHCRLVHIYDDGFWAEGKFYGRK